MDLIPPKLTRLQRRAALLKSEWAKTDEALDVTPEEVKLVESLLEKQQAKGFHLLSLLRSRIRNIRGVDSFVDAAKVCRKFDPKESAYISWVDFDWCMESLTLRMSSAEILVLMQLFDPRGTGQVEYMEVVAWLDPNAVVEVNKQCANTLTKLTYGSQKEKALQDRKPPSEGYMKAWLEKHPEKVSTGATFSLKPSEALVSAARLQDQINEARARTAYNNEKKVLAVQARRVQVRKEALARLQGKLASGVGQPDKGLALERAFAGCATSGLVSWKVFVAALKSVGVTSLTEEELSTLMAEFDANADGGLEYKEFLRTYVADYAHLGLDGALLEDFSRTTGFIQKTKQELAVKNYVKPKQPAQVDSLWSLEPGSSIRTEPDFSVSAAQTILPQGLHFQKLVPNGQWHRPRTGGRPFVPGEVGLFEW